MSNYSLDYYKDNGYKLKLTREKDDNGAGGWIVIDENNNIYKNEPDAEKMSAPIYGAIIESSFAKANPKRKHITYINSSELPDTMEHISVYLLPREGRRLPHAMNEKGNEGIGGSYPEAILNTGSPITNLSTL